MADAPDLWTEAQLQTLGREEYTYREFKASGLLSQDHLIASGFLPAISKQVSAFANGGGGRIFIGIDDDGRIDGGAPMDLKGGTRSWLEDVLPNVVDPPLAHFNVFEIRREDERSRISPGCAVYVIELESSPYAPHQALDYRFYLRIAGKSRPMNHVHIQDVLRRTHSPRVIARDLRPYGEPEVDDSDPRGACVFVRFQLFIANTGQHLAQHVGYELILPRPFVIRRVRERMGAYPEVCISQSPGDVTFFQHHRAPLFPRQEIKAMQIWLALHRHNAAAVASGAAHVSWRIFADDALPHTGRMPLSGFGLVRDALAWLSRSEGGGRALASDILTDEVEPDDEFLGGD